MYSYHYQYTGAHRKRKLPPVVYLVIFIIPLIYISLSFLRPKTSTIISPLPDQATPKQQGPAWSLLPKKKNPEDLKKRVQALVGNTWSNYSIYVQDFSSDFSVGINETVIYTAASVNKVPILAALYHEVQSNKIDLDKAITVQKKDIQDYGTGTIRYDPPGTVYSVKTLARLMMQKSDNTAAFILDAYIVGSQTVQELVNQWGLTQTDMINNKTSNKDMALLMEKIYKGGLINLSLTQEMLAFMKDSDFEERLPALLPKETTVYHKIGNEIGNIHDIGVVTNGKTSYYIGVLTEDITDEEKAKQLIAKISQEVYNFLK